MPSGTQQRYITLLGTAAYGPPKCVADYAYTINVGNDQWSRPDVQHRTRPQYLWQNPTSIGPYFEYRKRHAIERVYTPVLCNGRWQTKQGYATVGWDPVLLPPFPAMNWSNKLASEVKNLRLNLAEDLAEYREGLDAATSVAKKLFHGVVEAKRIAKAVRSGRSLRKEVKRLARRRQDFTWRDVPAAWLGINLAALPTLGTVTSVLETLSNPNSARPILRVIRFSQSDEISQSPPSGYVGVCRSTSRQSVCAVIQLNPQHSVWKDDFTVGNPAEWAWATLTLSFVVDWFIPVGNYLSSLDAYSGISGIWGTVSYRNRTMATGVKRPGASTVSPGSVLYTRYQRTAFTSPPSVPMPRWAPHASVKRLVTALSLLSVMSRSD